MKKLFILLLILALILPASAPAESSYTPALGMTIPDFIAKYNAIPAPLGSPFLKAEAPYNASKWKGYRVYWYKVDRDGKVVLMLMSRDPHTELVSESGLDLIQIYTENDNDLIPLIGVTNRCATLFATDLFGTSMAPMRVCSAINFYYENNCRSNSQQSIIVLDENQRYCIALFYDGMYCFQISPTEGMI